MRARRPYGLRRRLLLVVVLGAAAALAALTLGFNLALRASLHSEANSVLRARASDVLTTIRAEPGRLRVPEAPDDAAIDARTWVFAGPRVLERPAADAHDQAAANRLAGGPRRFADIERTDTRLYAVPITRAGRRLGTLIVGITLAPYERTAKTALVASLIFSAALLVLIGLAAWWAIGRALRPVARMTATAAAWSEHDRDRRFALGPPYDEITALGATFDALLERLSAVLRHEQRLTAEVSHELRTPLSRLRTEVDIALARPRGEEAYREALLAVSRTAEQMAGTLDTLLVAARAEASGNVGTSDAAEVVQCAVDACSSRVLIEIVPPHDHIRLGVEAALAERALGPLLDNAVRHARSRVAVRIARENGHVNVSVSDDGPGVPREEQTVIFEPGRRGRAARGDDGGAGLGLPLARRVARAAGGDVVLETQGPGATFTVQLPAA